MNDYVLMSVFYMENRLTNNSHFEYFTSNFFMWFFATNASDQLSFQNRNKCIKVKYIKRRYEKVTSKKNKINK